MRCLSLLGNLEVVLLQTIAVAVVLTMSGYGWGNRYARARRSASAFDLLRSKNVKIICASGALATLIPPSIIMIIYGLSAQVAIGDLFMAGAVPGLMLATLYGIYVLVKSN